MAHASFLCRNWPPVPWVTNVSFYFRHQQVSCTWRWEMHLDQRPTHHHCYLWIPSWSWWLLADGDTTSHGPDSIFQRIVMLRQLVGHCGAGVDFWWVHGDPCSTCWFKPIKSWYVIHITKSYRKRHLLKPASDVSRSFFRVLIRHIVLENHPELLSSTHQSYRIRRWKMAPLRMNLLQGAVPTDG